MVNETRSPAHYKPMPILFNEDNHRGFENNANNFSKTIKNYAGWECFDPGKGAGGTSDFWQLPSGISTCSHKLEDKYSRKKSYFEFLKKVTSS